MVIAILGILAAIAIPRFTATLSNAKLKADNSTAKTIQSAAMVYQADSSTNSLPTTISSTVMANYLSADTFVSTGKVKAPAQTGMHFWYASSTGVCVCSDTAANAATGGGGSASDYAQID